MCWLLFLEKFPHYAVWEYSKCSVSRSKSPTSNQDCMHDLYKAEGFFLVAMVSQSDPLIMQKLFSDCYFQSLRNKINCIDFLKEMPGGGGCCLHFFSGVCSLGVLEQSATNSRCQVAMAPRKILALSSGFHTEFTSASLNNAQ